MDPGPALDFAWLLEAVTDIIELDEDGEPDKLGIGVIVAIVLGGLVVAGAVVFGIVHFARNGCECDCECACLKCGSCADCCERCERDESKKKKQDAKNTDEARKFARLHSIKYDAAAKSTTISRPGSSSSGAPRSQTFSPRQPLKR